MNETKVLLVDDEHENIRYLTTILEENGFNNIFSAADGEEGLKQVETVNPGLIVLDIRMPRKSGILMFNDLKTVPKYKNIPIIVLTGEGEFLKRLHALRTFHEGDEVKLDKPAEEALAKLIVDRPEAFLEKPIEPEAFMETVRKVLS
jgi:two-component system, OmpR family, alkaline phosphatase synthesis response regulator PhoP